MIKYISFALVFAMLICACSEGDNYVLKTDSSIIEVNAYIGNDCDTIKNTTIAVNDTIYLNGAATSNGSLKLLSYFWSDETGKRFNDYQLKVSFATPGVYKPVFSIVDHFGDTLSDTVQIRVTTPPKLDSINFSPKNGTESIPANNVLFAWNVAKPENENIYNIKIQCANGFEFDTTLNVPYFKPQKAFPELEECYWRVESQDTYGVKGNSIAGTFTTAGMALYGRISGSIHAPKELKDDIIFTVTKDSITDTLSFDDNGFDLGVIPAGIYLLKAEVPKYTDYATDSVYVELHEGFYSHEKLHLTDIIPPLFPELKSDTLPYSSEIAFAMNNHGLPLSLGARLVKIDGQDLETTIDNDTLKISVPKYNLPICRALDIKVVDAAANYVSHRFYVCPQNLWGVVNNDTTVSVKDTITFTYHEQNPYNLEVKGIQWHIEYRDIISSYMALDENGNVELDFKASLLKLGLHKVYVKTLYKNGLQVFNTFNLEVTE